MVTLPFYRRRGLCRGFGSEFGSTVGAKAFLLKHPVFPVSFQHPATPSQVFPLGALPIGLTLRVISVVGERARLAVGRSTKAPSSHTLPAGALPGGLRRTSALPWGGVAPLGPWGAAGAAGAAGEGAGCGCAASLSRSEFSAVRRPRSR